MLKFIAFLLIIYFTSSAIYAENNSNDLPYINDAVLRNRLLSSISQKTTFNQANMSLDYRVRKNFEKLPVLSKQYYLIEIINQVPMELIENYYLKKIPVVNWGNKFHLYLNLNRSRKYWFYFNLEYSKFFN